MWNWSRRASTLGTLQLSSLGPLLYLYSSTELTTSSLIEPTTLGFVKYDVLSVNRDLLSAIGNEDWEWYRALVAPDMISNKTNDTDTTLPKDSGWVTPQSIESILNLQRKDPISNAVVEVMGTTVSYDRTFVLKDDKEFIFRETRTWRHVTNGWMMVHCTRTQ